MASAADAGVVLDLYKLRQDESLRAGLEFWPKDLDELRAVPRAIGSEQNAHWRQDHATGDGRPSWFCAARSTPDSCSFDSQREALSAVPSSTTWHAETEKESRNRFMKNTATLIDLSSQPRRHLMRAP